MYNIFLKEGNGGHKFSRCIYLRDNNFEVLRSEITLDKVSIDCVETVKAKPTGNYSDFITYSNTINFASKLLDNSDYQITKWQKLVK